MARILWLVSWFPSRVDKFDGDFIERHARAVGLFHDIDLIDVVKDEQMHGRSTEIETVCFGRLTIYRAYYKRAVWRFSYWQKIHSSWYWWKLHLKLYRQVKQQHGKPILVHVHVVLKAGLFALYLRWKEKLPYLLTEHWNKYHPRHPHSFYQESPIVRWLARLVVRKAIKVLPVCADLGQLLTLFAGAVPCKPISNVVDTTLFHLPLQAIPAKTFLFIHASLLTPEKNIPLLLQAFKLFHQKSPQTVLWIVGPPQVRHLQLAEEMGLTPLQVVFKGLQTYERVAQLMQQSHALVLSSHFENQPCVALEALCCGLPVIAPQIGGLSEIIHQENGMLVPPEDPMALAEAMQELMQNYSRYDRMAISMAANAQFNYARLGRQIGDCYAEINKEMEQPWRFPASQL